MDQAARLRARTTRVIPQVQPLAASLGGAIDRPVTRSSTRRGNTSSETSPSAISATIHDTLGVIDDSGSQPTIEIEILAITPVRGVESPTQAGTNDPIKVRPSSGLECRFRVQGPHNGSPITELLLDHSDDNNNSTCRLEVVAYCDAQGGPVELRPGSCPKCRNKKGDAPLLCVRPVKGHKSRSVLLSSPQSSSTSDGGDGVFEFSICCSSSHWEAIEKGYRLSLRILAPDGKLIASKTVDRRIEVVQVKQKRKTQDDDDATIANKRRRTDIPGPNTPIVASTRASEPTLYAIWPHEDAISGGKQMSLEFPYMLDSNLTYFVHFGDQNVPATIEKRHREDDHGFLTCQIPRAPYPQAQSVVLFVTTSQKAQPGDKVNGGVIFRWVEEDPSSEGGPNLGHGSLLPRPIPIAPGPADPNTSPMNGTNYFFPHQMNAGTNQGPIPARYQFFAASMQPVSNLGMDVNFNPTTNVNHGQQVNLPQPPQW